MAIVKEVALDAKNQLLILFDRFLEAVGNGFAVDAGIFADVCEGEFGLLGLDEGGQLLIIIASLCDFANHVSLRLR